MPATNRFLMMAVMACVLSSMLSVGAVAQSFVNKINVAGESGLAGTKGALAEVTVTSDMRSLPCCEPNHYSASPNYFLDSLSDMEVWFSDTSSGTPGGGTATKALLFSYHVQSGETTLLIEVPTSGSGYSSSNPYITVKNTYTGSSVQFRPGDTGAGGTLQINRPYIKNTSGTIAGAIYYYDVFNPITTSNYATAATTFGPYAINIWVHGVSTTPYVNISDGSFNITLSGGSVKTQSLGMYPSHTLWTFDLHPNLIPTSGNSKTIQVKVKSGLSGTWSPIKTFVVATP